MTVHAHKDYRLGNGPCFFGYSGRPSKTFVDKAYNIVSGAVPFHNMFPAQEESFPKGGRYEVTYLPPMGASRSVTILIAEQNSQVTLALKVLSNYGDPISIKDLKAFGERLKSDLDKWADQLETNRGNTQMTTARRSREASTSPVTFVLVPLADGFGFAITVKSEQKNISALTEAVNLVFHKKHWYWSGKAFSTD